MLCHAELCCAVLSCAVLCCAELTKLGFTTKDADNVPTSQFNPQFKSMQAKMRKGHVDASKHNLDVDQTTSQPIKVVIEEFLKRLVI
jgi:hypothetical protein